MSKKLIVFISLSMLAAQGAFAAEADICSNVAWDAAQAYFKNYKKLKDNRDAEGLYLSQSDTNSEYDFEWTVNEECVDGVSIMTKVSPDGQSCEVTNVDDSSNRDCG